MMQKMCLLLLLIVSMLGIITGDDASAGRDEMIDLKDYRWKNRIILIFAPSATDPGYRSLNREIQTQRAEIIDRDLRIFHILEEGESRLEESSLDTGSVDSLRDSFSPHTGQLTVVLIGKDGGEKLRQVDWVSLAEIFGLIDTMPMRQEEMRNRGQD